MPLPLEIPPGFMKADSPNAAKGRFTDGDKVRFHTGKPEKWLGWVEFITDTLTGIARGAVAWVNQYGNTNAAFGTHLKLQVITGDDSLADITPIRATSTINNNPFSVTSASTTVTVTDTAHGADVNDFVTFSGATAVGGITIDGEYQITEMIDNNSYRIEHTSQASSTTTGGGASVEAEYQINTGSVGGVVGLGWGAGTWGTGTWGTARTDGITLEIRHWSLNEYGNELLALPFLGGLYLWEEATDARAEVVSGAPTSARAMFVTGERFIMLLGTSTPMTVQWPDQDDITDWTPSTSNTANIRTLQAGSKLMAGAALADGISIVWSDTGAYHFQYTGSDFVYDSRLVGTNCGLIAPLGFAKVSGTAFWISARQFFMYGQGVTVIPNQDDIRDAVFDDMDPSQITKTWAEYDMRFQQIRWHYCSTGSTEPNKYVDVSIGEWVWTTGTLNRTTGTLYRPGDASSLLVDENGSIYSHNVGNDADGSALESYITFGLYALTNGQNNVDVMGIIPDCQRQVGNLTYEIYTKERPNSGSNFDEQTVTMGPTDEIGDARVSGRHFGMTVRSNVLGGDFRLGIVNLEVGTGGTRR
mgnify:CR=1 FL=1